MNQVIKKVLEWGTILSTVGFIGCTLIQVFTRFLLPQSPSWTEEASRVLFIYAVSFAAGLALKDRQYVYLDILYNRLAPKAQKGLSIGIACATILLFMVLGIFTLQFISLGIKEKSPSLGFPMAYAFVSMAIMAASVLLYAWSDLRTELNKRP